MVVGTIVCYQAVATILVVIMKRHWRLVIARSMLTRQVGRHCLPRRGWWRSVYVSIGVMFVIGERSIREYTPLWSWFFGTPVTSNVIRASDGET